MTNGRKAGENGARRTGQGRLFDGPILGGFECASHIDRSGYRRDFVVLTDHERQLREDYERALALGIRTIREGLRWHLIERGGKYDFRSIEPMVEAAVEMGITHINCLFHYGYPDDLDPLSTEFVCRFRDFAAAFARWRVPRVPAPRWYCQLNEPSMFAYAAGEAGWFAPFGKDQAEDLKINLARAAIAATDAIRQEDPDARFVAIDPIVNIVPNGDGDQKREDAAEKNEKQYQFWDMLIGRELPELGGRPGYLDVVGVNAYPDNQFDVDGNPAPMERPPRRPTREMLIDVWQRYRRPVLMAETSSRGRQRPPWIRMVTDECIAAMKEGVDFQGICIFPLVDMPEWKDGEIGDRGLLGLWDIAVEGANQRRILNRAYCEAVLESRRRLEQAFESLTKTERAAGQGAVHSANGASGRARTADGAKRAKEPVPAE